MSYILGNLRKILSSVDLTNNYGIVTGGLGIVGLSVCNKLMEHGIAGVTLIDSRNENWREVKEKFGNRVRFVQANVRQKQHLEEAFHDHITNYNQLDLLVNSAGANGYSGSDFDEAINNNILATVRSTYLGFQYMGRHMNNPGGTIVNLSDSSRVPMNAFFPLYSSINSFVLHFTKTIGSELFFNVTGVRVLGVCAEGDDIKEKIKVMNELMTDVDQWEGISDTVLSIEDAVIHVLKSGQSGSVYKYNSGTKNQTNLEGFKKFDSLNTRSF